MPPRPYVGGGARVRVGVLLAGVVFLTATASTVGAPDLEFEAAAQLVRNGKGRVLDDSPWPADHGDNARSKFTFGAGLPQNFSEDRLKVMTSTQLPSVPSWLYTKGKDELYVLSGDVQKPYVARLDARTLEVKQITDIPRAAYLGGMLIHGNGHVYTVFSNRLFRFWNGDLRNMTILQLPPINRGNTNTNGMLVFNDGNIVIKQWSSTYSDSRMMYHALGIPVYGVLTGLSVSFCIIMVASIWTFWPIKTKPTLRHSLAMLLISVAIAVFLEAYLVSSLIGYLCDNRGNDFMPFIMKTYKNTSYIQVVDPDTMEIVSSAKSPQRLSFARMALQSLNKDGEDVLVTLGDTTVIKWTYSHVTKQITPHMNWTESYRSPNDGSFFGTGPAIYNDVVYYTDNTFPLQLTTGYRMYAKRLDSLEPQVEVNLAVDSPGFMFWSVVINPLARGVIVWDTHNRKVQSRSFSNLSLQWEYTDSFTSDCISVAADKGHVYLTSVKNMKHPASVEEHFRVNFVGSGYLTDQTLESLVVLDAFTGKKIASVLVSKGQVFSSVIVPGANDDVLLTNRNSVVRVYVSDDSSLKR